MGPSLLVLLCTLSTQLPYSYGAPKSILNNGDIESILSPLKHNSNGNHTGTKYYNSTPHEWPSVPIIRHDSRDPSCNIQFKLKWNTHVGSSILSTPIIYPNTASTSNNKKQVFLSTYSQYIEMINDDGSKPFGWPLQFEDSSFLSTPILYDIDGDGTIDMGKQPTVALHYAHITPTLPPTLPHITHCSLNYFIQMFILRVMYRDCGQECKYVLDSDR